MSDERATEVRDDPSDPPELRGDPGDVDFFRRMKRHMPRTFIAVMRRLPAEPRCRLCQDLLHAVGFGSGGTPWLSLGLGSTWGAP